MLENNGSSLMSICSEICPSNIFIKDGQNKLIMEDLNHDKEFLKVELHEFIPLMIEEQTLIYNEITRAIERGKRGVYILYG